jgi:hypothetical protein
MGVTKCPTHGRSGIVAACEHVAVALDQHRFGPFHSIGTLMELFVCDECLNKYALHKFKDHPKALFRQRERSDFSKYDLHDEIHDEAERAESGMRGVQYFCSACVAAAQAAQATDESAK